MLGRSAAWALTAAKARNNVARRRRRMGRSERGGGEAEYAPPTTRGKRPGFPEIWILRPPRRTLDNPRLGVPSVT